MRAVKQYESSGNYKAKGGSGEIGAYQYTMDTFKNDATKYAKMPNANINNPVDQDKVMYYTTKAKKDAGYTPEQILSEHNSGDKDAYTRNHKGVNKFGVKYDTPGYVEAVKKIAMEQARASGGVKPNQSVSQETPVPQEKGGPLFKSSPDDSAIEAGLKTLGNVPGSLWGFGKGLLHALNPINTVKNLMAIPGAYREAKEAGATTGDILSSVPKATYEGLVPQGVRQVIAGDLEGAQKTFTEDPVGTVAPVVLAGVGGVKGMASREAAANRGAMADYVKNIGENVNKPIPQPKTTFQDLNKAIDTGISKTAEIATKPITAVGSKVAGGAGTLMTSIASHLTSLEPTTIRKILSDPKEFSKMAQEQTSRGGLAGEVRAVIESRLKDLSETGKGYDAVRSSKQTVQVPSFVKEVLESKGLKVKGGKIVADSNSITRNSADIKAIQKFYNDWGKKKTLTANEFLNMRGDLAELSKFDKLTGMGKTRASETIGKALYEKANSSIRNTQLEELKALDDTYSPEVQFLKQVKRDYFNRDGTFKDNAPSKIANAANKENLLARLEQLMPGITKRIEILKAVEDIETAMGKKVGTYTRGVLQGGAILSGNMPAILATIITHPSSAVRILRAAGYTAQTVAPVVSALKIIGGDVKLPTSSGILTAPAREVTP